MTVNGTRYAYIDEGEGDLLLFGHGLLASKEMFQAQIDALKDRWRCVSIDWPGHGESGYPEGGWSLESMGADAAALARELGYDEAVFIGLSQGGMAFMRLAFTEPEIVRALVLLDTSAGPENQESLPSYEQLREMLVSGDDAARSQAADGAQQVLYGQTWRGRNPEGLAHEKELMLAHDRGGIDLACRAVFDRTDVTGRIAEIKAPTLVICGEEDTATPPERAQELVDAIEGAELVMVPEAGHHTPIENPAPVTAALERFLARLPAHA